MVMTFQHAIRTRLSGRRGTSRFDKLCGYKSGWNNDQVESYKSRFGGFGRGVSRLPDAYRRLEDNNGFEMAGHTWRVITGHGHSPEHSCLFCEDLNIVISGDQLLPKISSNVSVFPTEPAADPLRDWLESCEKLKDQLPVDVLVLPAHNEQEMHDGPWTHTQNIFAGTHNFIDGQWHHGFSQPGHKPDNDMANHVAIWFAHSIECLVN